MRINLIADKSVASAPAGFTAAVQAAANVYDNTFAGNYTINITYGWGTYDNSPYASLTNPSSGVFSVGGFSWTGVTGYAQLKSLLTSHATSSAQKTAVQSLPASSSLLPSHVTNFALSNAEEKALGIYSGSSNAVDGSIGFNIGDASQSMYWEPAALTEIAHALGWTSLDPKKFGLAGVADLFRYSSAGNYQWTDGQKAYFSINGGKTDLADYSTTFDDTLFSDASLADPLRLPLTPSTSHTLTSLDIKALSVIGFSPATVQTTTSTSTSTIASGATTSGRNNSIKAQSVAAGFPDLASAFGANPSTPQDWRDIYGPTEFGSQFVESGVNAGPTNRLGGHDNIPHYANLMNAFVNTATFNAGAFESAHADRIGTSSLSGAFLSASSNHIQSTGLSLT